MNREMFCICNNPRDLAASHRRMPRQAHGRSLYQSGSARPTKRKPTKDRGLNALQIAEKESPDVVKISQHRLGESFDDDDQPRNRQDTDERSSKRRRLDTEQDEEDEDTSGSDLDGERWHVGVDDDDEDSDIESDDAFADSDEERFAGFSFRGSESYKQISHDKTGRPKGQHDAGNDESSGDDGDDLGDDAIDLATAWDMEEGAGDGLGARQQNQKKRRSLDGGSEDEGSELDTNSGSGSEDEDQSDLSVSEDDDGDHARLRTFVKGLSTDAQGTSLNKSGTITEPKKAPKISAADLLQYVKDPQQRQSLKILQSSEDKGPEVYTGGIPGRLAPPLAKRQQDRLDRSAAYEESKNEIGKWTETVKRNRRAEHVSFPLIDPNAAAAKSNDNLGPVAVSDSRTPLEHKIHEIMQENGLGSAMDSKEQEDREFEELQDNNVPLAEIQARRAELRKQRDLMFREEIRARRINKIKSKAYRRIHRKERGRAEAENRAQLTAAGLIDSDQEREQNDKRRAEERMGARHRESKWAKGTQRTGRAAWDEDARQNVSDLARRDEELRRRVEGKTTADSGSDAEDGSDFSGYEDDEGATKTKLDALEATNSQGGASRLENMAFMRKAEAARKEANDAEINELRRQLRGDDPDSQYEDGQPQTSTSAGRQKYGGQNQAAKPVSVERAVQKSEFEERLSEDDDDEQASNDDGAAPTGVGESHTPSDEPPRSTSRRRQKKNQYNLQNSSAQTQVSTGTNGRAVDQQTHRQAAKPLLKTKRAYDQQLNEHLGSSESEAEGDGENGPKTLAEAVFFGPDDVVQDFDKEKKEIVEDEGDQIIDTGLPGWGNWTGAGISKKQQKRDKGRSLTTIKGIAPEKRQDSKLDRVVINERRVKKNGKYLANELPHPFESQQQYERSLRLPLGPEWTTKSTFQDATKPRVLIKQGIIKPMASVTGSLKAPSRSN